MVEVNNKEIKYTFLLPAFKASFLEEALLSIKNQTFKDFMVLVSDDCSPEPIKQIFDKVVGDDSRFSYRRNEENMGAKSLVSHWNMLVDMCDTEYLIMASDDDVYEPSFLEEIDKLVKKYPTVDLFRARARRIEKNVVANQDFNFDEYMSMWRFITCFGSRNMVLCLANYVFRTKTLKDIGKFPDFPAATYSDSATAMLMARNGVATTENVSFTFRISENNLSSNSGYEKNIKNSSVANLMFVDWYEDNIKKLEDTIPTEENFLKPLIHIAHKKFVEGLPHFLFPRLSLKDMLFHLSELRRRGYLTDKYDICLILKNWIKLRS